MERLTCETIHLWETSKSPGDSSLKIYLTYSFFDLSYNLKQIFCKTPLLAFSRDFDSMSRKNNLNLKIKKSITTDNNLLNVFNQS